MVRIWFKVIKDNKTKKQHVYENDEKFTYSHFSEYVAAGCYALDEATPVIIKNHIMNFAKYNSVKFSPDDFVEKVDFDKLVIENLDR
ncbi:MAG: hypothetical protein IJ800_05455 [Clostridia bacterium]|nr:hypothetical protein [Clostridia bacterium]